MNYKIKEEKKIRDKDNNNIYLLKGLSDDMWFKDCEDCGEPRKLELTYCQYCYNKRPRCTECGHTLD